ELLLDRAPQDLADERGEIDLSGRQRELARLDARCLEQLVAEAREPADLALEDLEHRYHLPRRRLGVPPGRALGDLHLELEHGHWRLELVCREREKLFAQLVDIFRGSGRGLFPSLPD